MILIPIIWKFAGCGHGVSIFSSINPRPTGYPHSIYKDLRTSDGIYNHLVMYYKDFLIQNTFHGKIYIEQR